MSQFRLRKSEMLKDEQSIKGLFENGEKTNIYPILFIYGSLEHRSARSTTPPVIQCVFTVSKRRFRKATDRNRIKRLMRESYRLNKNSLHNALRSQIDSGTTLGLILVYVGKKLPEYSAVNNAIKRFIVKHTTE